MSLVDWAPPLCYVILVAQQFDMTSFHCADIQHFQI